MRARQGWTDPQVIAAAVLVAVVGTVAFALAGLHVGVAALVSVSVAVVIYVVAVAQLRRSLPTLQRIPKPRPTPDDRQADHRHPGPVKGSAAPAGGRPPRAERKAPRRGSVAEIFVVHGHDSAAMNAVALVLNENVPDAKVRILQQQLNSGRVLIEQFEEYGETASYAVILMTADDVGRPQGSAATDEQSRARQNVVFELGYFVGKLGRGRISILRSSGVDIPSDVLGVGYIEYSSSSGEWKPRLLRELDRAGFKVTWDFL